MHDFGRPSLRVPNYHMRSQQNHTEPAEEPTFKNFSSPKITYDVSERLVNLQKQQQYRRMLDEQVSDRNRLQAASHSYGRSHQHSEELQRQPPMTAFTDNVPYSPYSRERQSADIQFRRELELNRQRQLEEMNQIRKGITHQLQAVKVFEFDSAIPEEEKLGFSRYYSQHKRPKEASRSYLDGHSLKRNDSGRIEACLDECEAILNGFVEQTQNAYKRTEKKYNTVDHESYRKRIHTEAIGTYPLIKYDSINPNLFRLPELPIKKRPHYNGDIAPQLMYPKRANILKDDGYNKAKESLARSKNQKPEAYATEKKGAKLNSYPRPNINLLAEHTIDTDNIHENEQPEHNEFLAVKPQEPFASNIHIPPQKKTSRSNSPQALRHKDKRHSESAKKGSAMLSNDLNEEQERHGQSESRSKQPTQHYDEQEVRIDSEEQSQGAPKDKTQYAEPTVSPKNKETKQHQSTGALEPLVMQPNESPPSQARNSRLSNNSVMKLQKVPMTPRSRSKQNNHDETKSELSNTNPKATPAGANSITNFNQGGDTTSTMHPQEPKEDDQANNSEIIIKGKDIVSCLMRVKNRGSKLFQRIKEHKEALKKVRKLESMGEPSSIPTDPL